MVLALERNCRPLGLFGETAPQTPLLLLQGRMENKWITSMAFLTSWKGRREIQSLENGIIQP